MKAAIIKNTQDMILVAQIFDSGSITAACASIGLERTSLSRRLKALESRIGASLFDRSGQRIQLTDVGSTYLRYCYRIRELVEEAESHVIGNSPGEPCTLNVLADFEEAGLLLAPTVDEYKAAHSNTEIIITLACESIRTIPDDTDLVIQTSARRIPGVQYYELGALSQSIWAAPGLVKKNGFGDDPRLEENLPYLGMSDATDGLGNLRLASNGYAIDLPVRPRFRLPTLVDCRNACISELGIVVLPNFFCEYYEQCGQLTRVFTEWSPAALRLTAAHHHSSSTPRRIHSFVEFCKDHDFRAA